MAKLKGKGVVVAGILAGAASFLSKKENRDKAMEYVNLGMEKAKNLQNNEKVQSFLNRVPSNQTVPHETESTEEKIEEIASTAGEATDEAIDGNTMIEEGGAQTTIHYFNEEQEQKSQ